MACLIITCNLLLGYIIIIRGEGLAAAPTCASPTTARADMVGRSETSSRPAPTLPDFTRLLQPGLSDFWSVAFNSAYQGPFSRPHPLPSQIASIVNFAPRSITRPTLRERRPASSCFHDLSQSERRVQQRHPAQSQPTASVTSRPANPMAP